MLKGQLDARPTTLRTATSKCGNRAGFAIMPTIMVPVSKGVHWEVRVPSKTLQSSKSRIQGPTVLSVLRAKGIAREVNGSQTSLHRYPSSQELGAEFSADGRLLGRGNADCLPHNLLRVSQNGRHAEECKGE